MPKLTQRHLQTTAKALLFLQKKNPISNPKSPNYSTYRHFSDQILKLKLTKKK